MSSDTYEQYNTDKVFLPFDDFVKSKVNDTGLGYCKNLRDEIGKVGNLLEKRLLDMGCGTGEELLYYLTRFGEVCGIDGATRMVESSQQRAPKAVVKQGTFDAVPFESDSFDVVVSRWALNNQPKLEDAYREIHRLLKPGGTMVFICTHPVWSFAGVEKREGVPKDYFKNTLTYIPFCGMNVSEVHHSMTDFIQPLLKYFKLENFYEAREGDLYDDDGVQLDVEPSYILIRAIKS